MDIKLELKGMQELNRKLEGRIRRLEQSILRKALQAFAEPIRLAAERIAHTTISPRLKVVSSIKLRGSSGTVRVGPSTETFATDPTSGRSVSSANIGYWFEFGYEIRHTPKGPSLHHVGARPTLTPAYQQAKEQGLAAFEQVIRENLEAEVVV